MKWGWDDFFDGIGLPKEWAEHYSSAKPHLVGRETDVQNFAAFHEKASAEKEAASRASWGGDEANSGTELPNTEIEEQPDRTDTNDNASDAGTEPWPDISGNSDNASW